MTSSCSSREAARSWRSTARAASVSANARCWVRAASSAIAAVCRQAGTNTTVRTTNTSANESSETALCHPADAPLAGAVRTAR